MEIRYWFGVRYGNVDSFSRYLCCQCGLIDDVEIDSCVEVVVLVSVVNKVIIDVDFDFKNLNSL